MNSSIIKNISLKKTWLKLSNAEKLVFMTWSRSKAGWKKILTFNPVDIFTFRNDEDLDSLKKFQNKNKSKLIVGYISYDVGYKLHNIQPKSKNEQKLHDIYLLTYENFIEFNNNQAVVWYKDNSFLKHVLDIKERISQDFDNGKIDNFKTEISHSEYKENFEKIINYIKTGDIYQVNYTHRMAAETDMSGRNLFIYFLKNNPVDFAAYLESDSFSVCSLSPERFIKISGREILSQPIKGTYQRGRNIVEDNQNRKKLLASEKEKAELFMITDLIRNDLGKVCEIGSVEVMKKRGIQKLPKVFHTFSFVKGILKKGLEPFDVLLSMFPGGSITGCPKKRSMEIIDEIEPQRRGIYTGCIGYILPCGDAEFNIAIRTIVKKKQKLYLGVGGGITIESKLKNEYEESLVKAKSFLKE